MMYAGWDPVHRYHCLHCNKCDNFSRRYAPKANANPRMYSFLAGYSFFIHDCFIVPCVTISAAKEPLIVNTEDFACVVI